MNNVNWFEKACSTILTSAIVLLIHLNIANDICKACGNWSEQYCHRKKKQKKKFLKKKIKTACGNKANWSEKCCQHKSALQSFVWTTLRVLQQPNSILTVGHHLRWISQWLLVTRQVWYVWTNLILSWNETFLKRNLKLENYPLHHPPAKSGLGNFFALFAQAENVKAHQDEAYYIL